MPLGQKMMASSSFQLSLYCVGFFVVIWIAAVMFKSNDILRKQTSLKATAVVVPMSLLQSVTSCYDAHILKSGKQPCSLLHNANSCQEPFAGNSLDVETQVDAAVEP
ncbi:unnamed protein product [Triticum turgidum subsp. durum]|uniref:Uncharacterized protein n=3 Tax=Triticum TaxID=4564 RepID=A0A9R1BFU6_TRITD|nr:unnamed protein product [Triticum turgidum subsp. durum]